MTENKSTEIEKQKESITVNSGVTVEDFNKGVNTSIKLAVVNVLDKILGKHGIAEIQSPTAYALVHVNSAYINNLYPSASAVDETFVNIAEDYSLGKDRAVRVLEAVKVEIQKDFEIQKAQAKTIKPGR